MPFNPGMCVVVEGLSSFGMIWFPTEIWTMCQQVGLTKMYFSLDNIWIIFSLR